MTLRVTIEIIPYGDEDRARVIKTLNISNVTFREGSDGDKSVYVIEEDGYKNYDDSTPRVSHKREDGPEKLVMLALQKLLEG